MAIPPFCDRIFLVFRTAAFFLSFGAALLALCPASAQADDATPPSRPVKLIFIHHSCGENWLADGHGGLGKALAKNNYFVSDTNYGWGPNSIGDRTDITDWPEWFTGSNSGRYLEALFRESGKHSPYTRRQSDPDGENQIIMFKSCFPNSNLEGNPGDSPLRGHGLTVKNAKAIYNELLAYFATRPDKLFVAITAPPVQDRTFAANARAFNKWLVKDWLAKYKGSNVAVFDFYNVLTGPNNHHRFRGDAIEYVTDRGRNTLHYPTNGDDHPSPAGNRKATRELVPLLNLYFHRWQKSGPIAPPSRPEARSPSQPPAKEKAVPKGPLPSERKEISKPALKPATVGDVIDNFEKGCDAWAVFSDMNKNTRLSFAPDKTNAHTGKAGLRIEYDIAAGSWGTCSLVYPSPRDWGNKGGLSLYMHSKRAGQEVVIVAYQGGSSDDLKHFELRIRTAQDAVTGWQRVDIPWGRLAQPSWQGDPAVRFDPGRAMGFAFAFSAPEGGRKAGQIWVDDIGFLSAAPQ